jgi:hypothetical protein
VRLTSAQIHLGLIPTLINLDHSIVFQQLSSNPSKYINTEREMEMKREMTELRHFLRDEHPLIFNEEVKEDNIGRLICDGCLNQISGPNYSCKECSLFILHKSCAELPCELKHPLHPKHPLLLIHEYFWERKIKCEGCNKEEDLQGLIYHCSHSSFSLESKCASLPLTVQSQIHPEHPLTLVRISLFHLLRLWGRRQRYVLLVCYLPILGSPTMLFLPIACQTYSSQPPSSPHQFF